MLRLILPVVVGLIGISCLAEPPGNSAISDPDAGVYQVVGTGPTISVPIWLFWGELLLLILAALLTVAVLVRRRNLAAFFLFAATTLFAAGRAFDLTPVLFMHSAVAGECVAFFMPILWVRWVAPLFLVAFVAVEFAACRSIPRADS